MASPSISTDSGFTLIEVLMVLALASTIASLGLFASLDDYQGHAYRGEREIIAGALMRARSEAMANACLYEACEQAAAHGVYFGIPGEYVLFEGDSYETRASDADEVIPVRDAGTHESGMESVVFAAGTGAARTDPIDTLTLENGTGEDSVITVEQSGRILWTH